MRNLFYISLLLICFSCESDITKDFDYDRYVVVNSIISTDSTWVVNLHYTKALLDKNDFQPVTNADVHISVLKDEGLPYQNEIQEFTLESEGNGKYTINNEPEQGRNYLLTIEVNDQVITGKTYVPRVLDASIREREIGDTEVTIDIKEDKTQENYYAYELTEIIPEAEVTPVDEDYAPGTGIDNNDDSGNNSQPNDPIRKDPGFTNAVPTLTDNTGSIVVNIADGSNPIQSGSSNNGEPTNVVQSSSLKKYTLKVWAISIEYYDYLVSIQENSLPDSEKAHYNYKSNIVNGGGIFAGYNLQVFEIEVEY